MIHCVDIDEYIYENEIKTLQCIKVNIKAIHMLTHNGTNACVIWTTVFAGYCKMYILYMCPLASVVQSINL